MMAASERYERWARDTALQYGDLGELFADSPVPTLEEVHHPVLASAGLSLLLLRLDVISHEWGGNKLAKLLPVIARAKAEHCVGIVSFAGHMSNHLVALAKLCQVASLHCIAYVRDQSAKPSPFTSWAKALGADVRYVPVSKWRWDTSNDHLRRLAGLHPGYVVLPEAGNSPEGLDLLASLLNTCLPRNLDFAAAPVGTGGTLAALTSALGGRGRAVGIAAWRGQAVLDASVRRLLAMIDAPGADFELHFEFTSGGFGITDDVTAGVADWMRGDLGIPVDTRFTAKMISGLLHLAEAGHFPPGSKLAGVITSLPRGTELEDRMV